MNGLSYLRADRDNSRTLSLTPELVALCHRDVPKPDPDPNQIRFDDTDFDRAAAKILADLGDDPIWVFAYGSLIWKPAVAPVEQLKCEAIGWHRSFCLEMKTWRGTPEQPGLMPALRRGGTCTGLAQRLQGESRHGLMVELLRREIGGPIGFSSLHLIDLQSDTGQLRALCFYAEPDEVANKPELSLQEVAAILVRACGHAGSGAKYLFNTVSALEVEGIDDPKLWLLQELVATEIKRRYLDMSDQKWARPTMDAKQR